MTLTLELVSQRVKVNQHAKYLGQRSFRSKVVVHTHTHTHQAECSTWSQELTDNRVIRL